MKYRLKERPDYVVDIAFHGESDYTITYPLGGALRFTLPLVLSKYEPVPEEAPGLLLKLNDLDVNEAKFGDAGPFGFGPVSVTLTRTRWEQLGRPLEVLAIIEAAGQEGA